MSKQYSLADISRHFSLPESTTRYYCKRFAPYMPIYGEGRRRRYGEESLDVVACILEHMKAGKNAQAVERILAQEFPCAADAVSCTCSTQNLKGKAPNAAYENPSNGNALNASPQSTPEPQHPDYTAQNLQSATASTLAVNPNNAMAPQSSYGQNMDGQMQVMQLLEQQTLAMQSIAQSLAVLSTQKEDMQGLQKAALEATEENVRLKSEVTSLKTLLHSREQVHQDDLEQVRLWMNRFTQSFNKKMGAAPEEGKGNDL